MFSLDVQLFALLGMGHWLFDWLTQTEKEAYGKFKSWRIRLKHCLIYAVPSSLLILLFGYTPVKAAVVFLVLLVSHFVIDDRRLVTWWLTHVRQAKPESLPNLWWLNIATDQIFHFFFIFLLCIRLAQGG